jgi:hypothetical protein
MSAVYPIPEPFPEKYQTPSLKLKRYLVIKDYKEALKDLYNATLKTSNENA